MEHPTLPYADATIWHSALLHGYAQVDTNVPNVLCRYVHRRNSHLDADYTCDSASDTMAKGLYWFAAYHGCETTNCTLYIYSHLLRVLGIFCLRNDETAQVHVSHCNRSNSGTISSHYHQSLVENIRPSDGHWWIIRRYMQFCTTLCYPTYGIGSYRIAGGINLDVCPPLSRCTHTITSGRWIHPRNIMYFSSYPDYSPCVNTY